MTRELSEENLHPIDQAELDILCSDSIIPCAPEVLARMKKKIMEQIAHTPQIKSESIEY